MIAKAVTAAAWGALSTAGLCGILVLIVTLPDADLSSPADLVMLGLAGGAVLAFALGIASWWISEGDAPGGAA